MKNTLMVLIALALTGLVPGDLGAAPATAPVAGQAEVEKGLGGDMTEPSLIPLPSKLVRSAGNFTLTSETQVYADAVSAVTARQLLDSLQPATGFPLKMNELQADRAEARAAGARILLRQDASLIRLGNEGYILEVRPDFIELTAPTQAGLFYAVQTLRQLLPPAVFNQKPVAGVSWMVPCVSIEDQPRFAWRGLMLDCGHDFQTKAFVLRFIEQMALHKYNRFHWHLTDQGTWGIEIKGMPELLDPRTRGPQVKPGHYTQEDVREVIRYAAERHIEVVPEVDMPGHMAAALIAYPELDCQLPRTAVDKDGEPKRPWEICVGSDRAYAFAEKVLTQVCELFPCAYIHIGGDEVPKTRWKACPVCQAKIKKHGLADAQALQSYFIKHLDAFLAAKGKKLIGWDEILEGGLAPNATVMSWTSMQGGIKAAEAGHDVIMTPKQFTYFDGPNMSVYKVYQFEPVPETLTPGQAAHILGGQGQMWTDLRPGERSIDMMIHPRSAVLAEVLWSPKGGRDYAGLMTRLSVHMQRLQQAGVPYRALQTGTPFDGWEHKVLTKPEVIERPIPSGPYSAGNYIIKIFNERGMPLTVDKVEVVHGSQVLATTPAGKPTGLRGMESLYYFTLPETPATVQLLVRITGKAEPAGKRASTSTLYIEKVARK